MPKEHIASLQEASLVLEREANKNLGDVHDPALDTPLADGRTLRQALYDLTDYYKEHAEQLLWTKWDQRIPRSEAKRALAQLQGARAAFIALLSDLQDGQLDVAATATAAGATARQVALHALEEEQKTMELIAQALKGAAK